MPNNYFIRDDKIFKRLSPYYSWYHKRIVTDDSKEIGSVQFCRHQVPHGLTCDPCGRRVSDQFDREYRYIPDEDVVYKY